MSTKDLFNKNYLAQTNQKDAFSEVESADNFKALVKKSKAFVPQIDYSDPQTFARFGSARLYYKSAIERIVDFYPYDGSDAEINSFYNKSLDIEKYIFDKKYPRTTGYAVMSSNGWGTLQGSISSFGYGKPSSLEFIEFKGGPNTISENLSLKKLAPDDKNSKFQYSNVYDENIYTNAGLISNYGSGSRVSNLDSDFDRGVTVEFWAKTGSLSTSLTQKQVVLDMWNNEVSSSADYGRLTIDLDGTSATGTPWRISVNSGANGISSQPIGENINLDTLSDWRHYAFVLQNTGSVFRVKLYVNGEFNHARDFNATATTASLGTLNPKNMMGRIGALMTAPSGAAGTDAELAYHVSAGKLNGSIDEFRFWKVARDAEEIGRNWFTQVRGGVNTDIANTTLGLYYKFNEGITTTSSLDSVVLDYGGRICNGAWTGYNSTSRNTGSAIISASAATKEYEDPIIYENHAEVVALKTSLVNEGINHDGQNNAMFLNMLPSWIVEESEEAGTSDLEKLSHIVGSYFDKIYLQISALPAFRHATYTSSSFKPLPFSQHLPQSLGLDTPELFIDASVMEKFSGRTDKEHFENELEETKNLIYQNLYNNLASIYKSKGTERSIRNIFRCFNIDDNLIYLNTYAKNQTYLLKDNLKQTQKRNTFINFNMPAHLGAVVYQDVDPYYDSTVTRGFISGTGDIGYEDNQGMTVEAAFKFPAFVKNFDKVHREFLEVSLFGMQSASSDATYPGTTTYSTDNANFQVFAVRTAPFSKDVYFKLTSLDNPKPFNFTLTSSVYRGVYNDENWDISVALRPLLYPYANGLVSGSNIRTSAHNPDKYEVVFRGFNNKLGEINNSFELTASIRKATAQSMLRANKRIYAGARNENITGSNLVQSDVLLRATRYWTKFVDNRTLKQHVLDRENYGITNTLEYTDFLPHDAGTPLADMNAYSHNFNTLALNWYFGTITGSDASGNFYTSDLSSGSVAGKEPGSIQAGFSGMAAKISEYIHGGKGHGFLPNNSNVTETRLVNEFKFINPEQAVSSDMVKLQTDTDELFENNEAIDEIPNYLFSIEKSLNAALSEEILDFFAGAIDFNNLIGDPVNRYRMEYKDINFLRRVFFERFNEISEAEKYIEYFKWFDDAISTIVTQMIPASADIQANILNVVESHVLERNKYQTMFPTLEFRPPDPAASARGFWEKYASYIHYLYGGLEASPRPTNEHKDFWLKRAQPGPQGTGDFEITSDDVNVDKSRVIIRNQMHQRPEFSGSAKIFKTPDGQRYMQNAILDSQLNGVVALQDFEVHRPIKGGVNFERSKDIHYVYTALYPAGPVNTSGSLFIPENVLFAETTDFEPIESATLALENRRITPITKRKRYVQVVHGRDYDGGLNYTTTKNSIAFPFNIMSGAISGGVDNMITERVTGGITLANLHNDVYGDDMEVPLQGPFTERVVGGHQSRHIGLNVSRSAGKNHGGTLYNGLDDYAYRPEAWKILLGKRGDCTAPHAELSGAIGMAGPDYPWPEANDVGARPYPMTASQKAVYYRDHIAKRPVNIRNIQMGTGSVLPDIGNYSHQYEILHSFGADINPRNFVENQPSLPPETFQNLATSSTQTRTFLDIHRQSVPRDPAGPTDATDNHFQFMPEYDISYINGTKNKSIITNRYSTAGGMLTDGNGYRDFKSNEYSVYVAKNYMDLTVIKPWQGPKGTVSERHGVGTSGIRVSDIHQRDYGLTSHYARHTAKFGRDSLIYPLDIEREEYSLTKDFVGYDGGIYRSSYGLQGWWRLSSSVEAGDVLDDSGCGKAGTFLSDARRPTYEVLADGPKDGPGIFGVSGSAKFNHESVGANNGDAINIGLGTTWDAIIGNAAGSTRKMTFAAWVYKTGDGGNGQGQIIQFGAEDFIKFRTNNFERLFLYVDWSTTDAQFFTTQGAISLNKWHHVVVTYDANDVNNRPVFYVDGQVVPIGEGVSTSPAGNYKGIGNTSDAANNCVIGNSPAMDKGWEGNLADVAVWNRILEAEEVQAIYNASKTSTEYGPGTTYNQLPGFHKIHRNNLRKIVRTERLVPVYTIPNPLSNTRGLLFGEGDVNRSASRKLKKAGAFSSAFSSNKITIHAWFSRHTTNNNGQNAAIVSLGQDNSSYGNPGKPVIRFGLTSTFRVYFRVKLGNSAAQPTDGYWYTNDTIAAGSGWKHLAVSYDAKSTSNDPVIYINGVAQQITEVQTPSVTGLLSPSTKSPGDSYIGSQHNGSGDFFTLRSSSIDEVAIYDTNLSSDEISTIYCGGATIDLTSSIAPKTSNLITWMRLGDGVGDPAGRPSLGDVYKDVKGNNNFTVVRGGGELSAGDDNLGSQTDVIQGCTGDLSHYATLYDFKTEENDYDNFFVQRPIPRSTTQYRWISSSLDRISGSREFGYVRPDYTYRITASNGTVSYEEPLNFITASDVGIQKTDGIAVSYATTNRSADLLRASDNYGTFLPVDFAGLNTIIYEPLTASSNTLGLPVSITVEPAGQIRIQPGQGRYLNDIALGGTISTPSYNLLTDQFGQRSSETILNSLLLNRNGPYGWVPFKQIRQRNHPILRNERRTNKISIKNEFNLPGSDKYGTPYASAYAIAYDLGRRMNIIDAGGGDNVYESQDSLQGWWRFKDVADTDKRDKALKTVPDSSGKNRIGSYDASSHQPTQGSSTASELIQSQSAGFHGGVGATPDALNIGTSELWNGIIGATGSGGSQKFTIGGWIRKSSDGGGGYGRMIDFSYNNISLYTNASERVRINIIGRNHLGVGVNMEWETATDAITLNEWAHVMFSYDATSNHGIGAEPILYINGLSQSIGTSVNLTCSFFPILSSSSGGDCYIGNRADYERTWGGRLMDIAVWDDIIPASQIKALYTTGPGIAVTSKPASAIESTGASHLNQYALRPVSMKGRPVFVNMDFANSLASSRGGLIEKRQNATFKTSHNNEEIFFNEQKFTKLMEMNKDLVVTPFEQLVTTKDDFNTQVNWILYNQNVFPSHRMEFASESVTRPFYDNKFWKDDQNERVAASIGYGMRSSLGAYSFGVFQNGGRAGIDLSTFESQRLTQSIWPLDAPIDFETRTKPPEITTYPSAAVLTIGETALEFPFDAYMASSLLVSNSAGELQNTYSSYNFTNRGPASSSLERLGAGLTVRNGALYARKHMLHSPLSVSPPSSIQNINMLPGRKNLPNQVSQPRRFLDFVPTSTQFGRTTLNSFTYYAKHTGSQAAIGIEIDPHRVARKHVATGSGEAKWEAPALAGYLTVSNGVTGFVSAPSKPWYNDYDEFRQDIKTIAKGYAVVPEFRMSEKVEDFYKFGPQAAENFDLFSIPGTTLSSSNPQFYKDYSNSDFMENILDIKQLSDLTAKEIRVTCHAAIKFNPYKGFYPAQRTLDLVSQFSKSYGSSVIATDGKIKVDSDEVLGYSYARSLTRPLFAPGILYNSIKAGLAVDYPIITNGDRVHATHVTSSNSILDGGSENWLIGARATSAPNDGKKGEQASNPGRYLTGSFFDQRVPFEAIINPAKELLDVYVCDIEPHPSMSIGFDYGEEEFMGGLFKSSFGLSASISSPPTDNIYTLMASNFFAEVGKFFLKDSNYTKLSSNGISTGKMKFGKGEVYGARLKIKTSYTGSRTYDNEFDAMGAAASAKNTLTPRDSFYSTNGCRGILKQRTGSEGLSSSGSFPIPQDPAFSHDFRHDFIMYSRTTAFGPPMLGRPYAYSGMSGAFGVGGGTYPGPGVVPVMDIPMQVNKFALSASFFGHRDSLNGYNWAYTPPYHNGEAWVDFIFRPTASVDYDMQRILAETVTVSRRFDPGPTLSASNGGAGPLAKIANSDGLNSETIENADLGYTRALVRDLPMFVWRAGLDTGDNCITAPYNEQKFAADTGAPSPESADPGTEAGQYVIQLPTYLQPYAGVNINSNAMQLDASLNLFGIEDVYKKQVDKFGNEILSENEVIGQRWVIQPKFETPMMNFSDIGVRGITSSIDPNQSTLTLPANFGSESVPRGMWHQFGLLPDTPEKGIFIELGDIPRQWLENHYEVFDWKSPYNDYDASVNNTYGDPVYKKMKSFTSLMGFSAENSSARLGELKDNLVIKEAVVAIPYLVEGLAERETQIETGTDKKNPSAQQRKRFINIPKKRVQAARKEAQGSLAGDTLDTAGASIRKLMAQMENYVMPPQFDFINNSRIQPIVMYMFEFEYEFDKDDLSYIWQNLAPRNSDRMELKKYSVAHELMNTELLTEKNLLTNDNLRWMVFKVKQKSQASYDEMISSQVGEASKLSKRFVARLEPPYKFNWPYDFVSIVESIKLDVEVLYKDEDEIDKMKLTKNTHDKQRRLNKKMRRKKEVNVDSGKRAGPKAQRARIQRELQKDQKLIDMDSDINTKAMVSESKKNKVTKSAVAVKRQSTAKKKRANPKNTPRIRGKKKLY